MTERLHFPSPGDILNPGISNPGLLHCRRFFTNWVIREAWIIRSDETPSFSLINPRSSRSALDRDDRSWAIRVRKTSFPGPSLLASPRGRCSSLKSASRGESQPLLCFPAAAAAKSLQSCPTPCDPIDGSSPGSTVPGILQARTLKWVAISFSNAWKWKVKVKSLSRVWPSVTPWTAAIQAPPSMGFSRQEYWSGVPLPPGKPQNKYKWSINRFKVFSLTNSVHKVVCLRQYGII